MALESHKPHKVYAKASWLGAWTELPFTYAASFNLACAPDVSAATLMCDYGRILQPGQTSYANYAARNLLGQYLKIAVEGGPTWYGVCLDELHDREGLLAYLGAGVEKVPTGLQQFTCRGLEYLLQNTIIDTSFVDGAEGEYQIGRAIGFNLGAGVGNSTRRGNRSNGYGANSAFVFADDLQSAEEWTAFDIIEYLLKYHFPADQGGLNRLNWAIAGATELLSAFRPALHVHGRSLWSVLNELIDLKRLMTWHVSVEPLGDGERPVLRIFTFNRDIVTLPDGTVIPANANQVENWNFEASNLVQSCTLSSDDTTQFHRVVAKGDPPGGCFTIGLQNGLLEADWLAGSEDAYKLGASMDPAYSAYSSDIEKHHANRLARAVDGVIKVYRYWRVPLTFNGYVGDQPVWPIRKDFPAVSTSCWWPGLRFQDYLPLRTEHNYEDPTNPVDFSRTGSKWEYRRPFAIYSKSGERAFYLDQPGRGESIDTAMESGGRHWSVRVRMQDDAFGVALDVQGAPQHTIAATLFDPADDVDGKDFPAELDPNYIFVTVFAEGDGNVQAQYPPQNQLNVAADILRTLLINIPGARLDYVVAGTYIDILSSTGEVVTSAGGYVRDDLAFLENVARSAYEWYSQPRRSIEVKFDDLTELRVRGQLIQTIGTEATLATINSVVTNCAFDLFAGIATYTTQFAQLELA